MPADNLFFLLATAFGPPDPFLDAPAEADRIEDVLGFVVARFAALVEARIDRGLYRAYVEEEDNLGIVGGRIAIIETSGATTSCATGPGAATPSTPRTSPRTGPSARSYGCSPAGASDSSPDVAPSCWTRCSTT